MIDEVQMLQDMPSPSKVLIFDIKGPMAQFRKYFANKSSLSHLIPPRSVVAGLIAGLLGLPNERGKDEAYYEKFDEKKCFIAISPRTMLRKIVQTVNYLPTDEFRDKNQLDLAKSIMEGFKAPTQVPVEILLPQNNKEIKYRIFFYHAYDALYKNLKERLIDQRFVYPPYLGMTEFIASIDYVGEGGLSQNFGEKTEISSVCRKEWIKEIIFDEGTQGMRFSTEKMLTGFLNDRTHLKPQEYVFEVSGRPFRVKFQSGAPCYSVTYSEDGRSIKENIVPM
jgi:CRISPR-associated protein Cas5h